MPVVASAAPMPPPPQLFCLAALLADRAEQYPDAPAILAPGRTPLTYCGLWQHVNNVVQTLHAMELNRHDRIALALPNGPEMAVAVVAVAAGATCVPLHPAYGPDEYHAYLAALHPKVLIVQAGTDSAACVVARARGIHVLELSPRLDAEAGLFRLIDEKHPRAELPAFAQPDDVALVLQTAGTTSQPKTVPLTHTNICASAYATGMALALTVSDRCLNVLPLFHAHALLTALLASLAAGASVVCTAGFSAPQFFAWMAEFRPTWSTAVPALYQAILEHAALHREIIAPSSLRFLRTSSAALPPALHTALERVFGVPVLGAYGMTETSSQIACNPLPPHVRKVGSVGVAAGPEVAIMDAEGTLLPAGQTGEIVARSTSVMQGYDNDPPANRSAFRHGWFRTGDQGFMDADGYLFITGRIKELINRSGEKIAPQEVDDVLMAHPAVAQAVTFAMPHTRLGEEVAAAVVLRQGASITEKELRQFVAARLAVFKVPRRVFMVAEVPKGPSGKLRRLGIAEYLGLEGLWTTRPDSDTHAAIPRTQAEELLARLWAQVISVECVGIHDDFFALGGDSLVATQLISLIREATQVEVSFPRFFDAPTVAEMAKYIEEASQAMPDPRAVLLQPVPRSGPLPTSYAQQRLWFLDQLGLNRHAYHLLEVLLLRGPLQATALAQSLRDIVKRHEVLRTTFTDVAGQPLQVMKPTTYIPMSVVDLQELSQYEREAQVHRLAQAEVQRPFDLTRGPLLRAALVHLADDEYVLLLTMHHIISDGWSHGVFWRELALLYEAYTTGQPARLPALSLQYADFAHWQQQWLQGEVMETQLAYWKQQLAGMLTLQLPTDHQRPAVQTFRGARHFFTIPLTLTHALKTLGQRHGVTLFMILLAAFQTLLHRYTGQDDIAVGSLIANRNRVELEGLIGFFVNTLVLRTDLSDDPSFRELLTRVRTVTLGAYEHQDMPFEKLLEALRPPRDLSRTPLFQILFVLHNTPQQGFDLSGLTVRPMEIDPGISRFDVSLEFWETSDGLRGRFEYSTDLFEKATIVRMAGHLQTLLAGIVAVPEQRLSRLLLLTAAERHRLLVEWNATTVPYPDNQCIHSVFETQVRRTPDAVAVICGDAFLTYSELNGYANQVAHYLQKHGVRPETLVGLCIERSLAMVVGLLGILKAGGAYLPLDPTYPRERLAFMLDDAQPPVILTEVHLVPGLPAYGVQLVCLDAQWPTIARYSNANPVNEVIADNVAYLLYTSGSTGRPKGVLGMHRATLNALAWMWQAYPFATHEVCCQKTPISFGDSIQELLGPLLQGRQIVLITDNILKELPRFVQALARHRVTRLILVPSLLRALLDTMSDLQDRLPHLTLWFTGGEALSSDLWQRFREHLPHCRLVNLYGASEASDDTTSYDTSLAPHALACMPIGRPIANTQIYVLDQHLQPVPVGVPGELYVGGAGLTRGYLHFPELTAERFIPHPFSREPGARLYKTGDLVRYQPDGHLEYKGRLDQQVKLRGIRIELGEIEATLAQHPAVQETAVIAREDVPGEPRLVAYFVPVHEPGPTLRELRNFLEKQLPAAMVPSTFVMLEALPLTPSGKVDRLKLPQPVLFRPALEDDYVAPRTPVEQQVATIWCRLLGLERVGVHDNFFELGGHSLLAMQIVSRVRDATHVQVSLLHFFETPTVAGIVAIIETGEQRAQGMETHALVSVPREGTLPASIAQEHFWVFDQLLPNLPLFNIPYIVRLMGRFDVATLERSFNALIERHESLRTTFASVDEQLVQVIAPTLHMRLAVQDLRGVPETEREDEAQRLVHEESQRPFDLVRGPLIRGCLLWLGEQEYRLLVTLHHIICDGWSLGILMRELASVYDAFTAGKESPLPALPIQYADFAAWQRQWQHHAVLEAQLVYWQEQLRGPLPVLALPADRPRGTAVSWRTARQLLELPRALFGALKDLSQREGSTLFMTCLTAFKVLLYGYTGQEDLCVATLVANRTRQETEQLIGLLVNTVLLRTDLRGNPTCREVLQRVRATTLAAYDHQDLPFEELIRTLECERTLQRTSLCQVMMIWQNFMLRPLQYKAQTFSLQPMEQSTEALNVALTTFDLVLALRERPQGLTATCTYKTDLFDAATIGQMLDDFQYVLACLSAKPERALVTFLSPSLQNVRS
jgi:amino acid adenylation domain-containing protein